MPEQLDWPFRGREAVASGLLSDHRLRRCFAPVYPGVHIPRNVELSARQRARAAWLWSRRRGVVAGLSAAAVLGAKWIEPELPAELVHTNRRQPPNLLVHTDDLASGETQRLGGMTVTTAARTAFDIGRRLDLVSGVQRVDALMNATDLKVSDIESVAALHPGVRGMARLRRTLDLVDGGAESPWESLTRLMFVQAGFPRPETQIPVYTTITAYWSRSSIWAGAHISSALTSKVRIIGPIRDSGIGTSSGSPDCPSSAGGTFE